MLDLQELRSTLVSSLDHIRTFVHLIDKTYRYEIHEEQIQVRDDLVQSIRADFNIMETKLSQTVLGVSYSRWSLDDYKRIVLLIKSMQQSLITVYSSLRHIEKVDAKTFNDNFGFDGKDIRVLRKYIYVGLTEIQKELAVGSETATFVKKELELLKEIDLERGAERPQLPILAPAAGKSPEGARGKSGVNCEAAARLRDVETKIALEISEASPPTPMKRASTCNGTLVVPDVVSPASLVAQSFTTLTEEFSSRESTLPASAQVNDLIRVHWNNFQKLQYDRVGEIFLSGTLYHPQEPLILEELHVSLDLEPAKISERSMLSSQEFRTRRQRFLPLEPIVNQTKEKLTPDEYLRSLASKAATASSESLASESTKKVALHRSLIRVYSHSFAVGLFIEDLIKLREFVLATEPKAGPRKKKLHLHFLANLIKLSIFLQRSKDILAQKPQADDNNLTIREALDILEKRDHYPMKVNWLQQCLGVEKFLRSSESCCAFKVACGVIVLAIMFWSKTTRSFALDYSLNSAVITITVAITPTLGQSWLSFLLQISGQGLGLVYSMIVLEIFHNVGGYKYNPYGIVSALAVFSIPMCYMIYTTPQLFVLAVLAMNSAATTVYSEYLSNAQTDDSPPYHMGKSLATLAFALALACFLQLFVLRNPGRRNLRRAIAKVMTANTAYTLILQSYVKATIPTSPSRRPPLKVIQRVEKDLIDREIQIQNDITALMPLMKFARAEPSFVQPFNAAEYVKIARANQLILDRNRDARIAIGTSPLPDIILKEFVEKLAPYRAQALPRIKNSLYLCTSTLCSKFPLPENLNRTLEEVKFGTEIFHDALVLSSRLAHSQEGLKLVKSSEFTRYWLYLLSMTSVIYQLEAIQESAKNLFGKLEDQPFYSLS
ncbi:hypothetical protein O181_003256 [Austropuccinia psidii MF-1]|uniref:Uncharacterized protein n=1 Tax=Austropuccinia psidii MF-1 TaxID=1389203 RepID=A0A9Q3GDZ7_9BASI|nr:hypothetical protein [Austropuccinia psidii MF-1]